MAWPAWKTQITRQFEKNDEQMLSLRAALQTLSTDSETRDIPRERVVRVKDALESLVGNLNILIAVGQRAATHAVEQYDDDTLDAAAEYTAVRNAAQSLADWIGTAVADDTAMETWDAATETIVREVYTSAQLAGLRTRIAAFVATIATGP